MMLASLWAGPAAAGPSPLWIKQLGTKGTDAFNAAASDSAGNIVAAGHIDGNHPWIVKFNSAGTVLWQKRPGQARSETTANGVAVDVDDNIIVAIATSYPNDTWILKYDRAGTLLWARRYDSGTGDYDFRVAVDHAGNIYTAGQVGPLGNVPKQDFVVVKYNAKGDLVWSKKYGTSKFDSCNNIAVDKDGNVILVGDTEGPFAGPDPVYDTDVWVAKLDASGTILWKHQFDSISHTTNDRGNAVTTDASGNVFIGGMTLGKFSKSEKGGVKAWLAKYSAGGQVRWLRTYAAGRGPNIASLATDASSNVFATGPVYWFFPSKGGFISKYSAAGALLWDAPIDPENQECAAAVLTDDAGDAYVAGCTKGDLQGANKGSADALLAEFPPR